MDDRSVYFPVLSGEAAGQEVIRIGRESWRKGMCIRRKTRDNYVLFCLLGGKGGYIGQAGSTMIGPGWTASLSPHSPHCIWCIQEPMEVIRVVATGGGMRQLFQDSLGGQCVALPMRNPSQVQGLFTWLFEAVAQTPTLGRELARQALGVLLLTIRRNRGPGLSRSRAEETYLVGRSYLERHFDRQITVARLAEEAGVRSEHLARLFQRFAGEPPSRLLQRLRMNKAAHLLADTGFSVARVSRSVGYADPFAFSKAFRRSFGLSPVKYRALQQES
jgi:AraC-like DNA-binding protein